MRYLIVLLVAGCSLMNAQTYRYISPGQKAADPENTCLVLKNDLRLLLFARNSERYKDVGALKLVGFNSARHSIDSLLKEDNCFAKVKCIIFENCDLSLLQQSLQSFPLLEQLQILNCRYYEDAFFPLLKKNRLREIKIQSEDHFIEMDSLCLLSHLQTLNISSSKHFILPNKTDSYRYQQHIFLPVQHSRRQP
jgi:hypothetical protein